MGAVWLQHCYSVQGVWPSCCLPCELCSHVATTKCEWCGWLPPQGCVAMLPPCMGLVAACGLCGHIVIVVGGMCGHVIVVGHGLCDHITTMAHRLSWWAVSMPCHCTGALLLCHCHCAGVGVGGLCDWLWSHWGGCMAVSSCGGSMPTLPHVPCVCIALFACGGPCLHVPCLVLSGVRWERMGMGWGSGW